MLLRYIHKISWIWILLFPVFKSNTWEKQDSLIQDIVVCYRTYELQKVKSLTHQVSNPLLKSLIQDELDYLEKGITKPFVDTSTSDKALGQEYFAILFFKAQQIQRGQVTDYGIVFKFLKEALNEAEQAKDVFFIKEFTFELAWFCRTFSRKEPPILAALEEYTSRYQSFDLSRRELFQLNFLKTTLIFQQMEHNSVFASNDSLEYYLSVMKKHSKLSPYFYASYHKREGIYRDVFTKEYDKAYNHFLKARKAFKSISGYFSQKNLPEINNSIGVTLLNSKKYQEALAVFKPLLKEEAIVRRPYSLELLNNNIYRAYRALGVSDSALHYYRKKTEIKDSLDKRKHVRAIHDKETFYQTHEKNEKIKALEQEQSLLERTMNFLWPGLLVFAILSFVLYRRYFQSRKEVKTIADTVIKNHIVLSDKTKVYIADLMYIKSDGHFIKTHTSDGKAHFVRGVLTDLETQLPPNFIRIHRSYIVNRNYIRAFQNTFLRLINGEEIPIGRTYRKKYS